MAGKLYSSLLAVAFAATTITASPMPLEHKFADILPLAQRPTLHPFPHDSGRAIPHSPPRSKHCFVKPANTCVNSTANDDAPAILQAFQDCNHGGTVVLYADQYTVKTPLDLTFLEHVDVALLGTLKFGGTIEYWTENAFQYAFQNSTAYWQIGGKDVNIFGGKDGKGVIDGNGQMWWDAFAENDGLLRPISLVIDGLEGGSVSGISMVKPPNWFNLIANSTDILISDMTLTARSSNDNEVKNSDGWDTYRSSHVVIQNSVIENTDDCVSFKPNSTDIVVQGLHCNGSHGISVGSLGQYVDQYDIVENVLVYDNFISNASDAARIKVWPGIQSNFQTTLNGGGGSGYVKNITYEKYHGVNNQWMIEINQCYGQSNSTLCEMYPSNMTISDIYFKDMWGTTSVDNDPYVGTLVCSSPEQCHDIYATNVTAVAPSGASKWICRAFDTSGLEGFDCYETEE